MSTSAIPALIDALVSKARTALPNIDVYDGYGISDDPGDFLMVGVDDPDSQDSASSTDSAQQAATLGTTRSRDETGEITCVALSWNGDGDQKAARDAVFATTAAVEGLFRADPSLGVSGYQLLVCGYGASQRLMQSQDDAGTQAAVVFSVRFRARL